MQAISANMLRDKFTENFAEESQLTRKILQAIPEDKLDFSPHEKSMSLHKLAWHIITTESWFMGAIAKGSFGENATPEDVPKEMPATSLEMADIYARLTTARLKDLRKLDNDALLKELDFFGVCTMPAIEFTNWSIRHTIHHRGQLSVYLRLAGANVPSVYGPSADEE